MHLRPITENDVKTLIQLFHDTVHSINIKDYSKDQVDAWAPPVSEISESAWTDSFRGRHAVLAETGGIIIGFADAAEDGYLDRFYVHKDFQGKGIGSLLYRDIESFLMDAGAGMIVTHASITALPFFLSRGFSVEKEQEVEREGVILKNFVLSKKI
ncbi:MAG: GNAT family N-acetyltransferase [Clostridia bacterium]|nr:GNAT family N-acetyltransferase [Clostridia bacterium]